jgi:Xaa-Pro aminopeptidase
MCYCSDITRTFPASGRFTPEQRDVYAIVLEAQEQAIRAVKPGVPFREIHLLASLVLASGLKELGLMKGDPTDAMAAGAHALFFQCGLGHMMGLDVHDMEDLGEEHVGYDETVQRSTQFGLDHLRMARALEPGFVMTVEPGVYLIPELIDLWRSENRHADFIQYDRVEAWRRFGGVRIEDDLLVTGEGYRVLGKPIPKSIKDVEALASE